MFTVTFTLAKRLVGARVVSVTVTRSKVASINVALSVAAGFTALKLANSVSLNSTVPIVHWLTHL